MSNSQDYITEFKAYDLANPQVWVKFEELALKAAQSSRRRFGGKAMMEHIRWDVSLCTTGDYKIDTWTAFYIRKFLMKYPQFRGFFKTLPSYADDMRRSDFDKKWVPIRKKVYTLEEIQSWGVKKCHTEQGKM